ncbi:M10 family metallopeptidase C-terminal domain-containing protein, partial [Undibacterium fentianense]
DNIVAGSGNNTIIGGAGNDTISCGSGVDIVVFGSVLDANTNVDTISWFKHGVDSIALSRFVFSHLPIGPQISSDNFVANTNPAARDANDYILYNTTNGKLFYDSDGSGA